MNTERFLRRGFSTIRLTAMLCILGLATVIVWQFQAPTQTAPAPIAAETPEPSPSAAQILTKVDWQKDPNVQDDSTLQAASSTDPDGLSHIGQNVLSTLTDSYASLQESGQYSPETGQKIASDLAPTLEATVSYTKIEAKDIETVPDTSVERMLEYRADMRAATSPLLNNAEPEFVIYARYIDTHDTSNLAMLKKVAQNYRDAVELGSKVTVPADAVSYHVAILNSLSAFAATLDAMSTFADDPFASAALLRTYNAAEHDVLTSFNNVATFYKQKVS